MSVQTQSVSSSTTSRTTRVKPTASNQSTRRHNRLNLIEAFSLIFCDSSSRSKNNIDIFDNNDIDDNDKDNLSLINDFKNQKNQSENNSFNFNNNDNKLKDQDDNDYCDKIMNIDDHHNDSEFFNQFFDEYENDEYYDDFEYDSHCFDLADEFESQFDYKVGQKRIGHLRRKHNAPDRIKARRGRRRKHGAGYVSKPTTNNVARCVETTTKATEYLTRSHDAEPTIAYHASTYRTAAVTREQQELNAALAQSRRDAEAARAAQAQVDRAYAAEIGLTPQQLAAMMARELTPEDYELLLQLDSSVKPKTLDEQDLCAKVNVPRDAPANDDVCMVCLDELADVELSSLGALPCGHVFHDDCIRKWLGESATTCPVDNISVADM